MIPRLSHLASLAVLCVGVPLGAQRPFAFERDVGIAATPERDLTCVALPAASVSIGQRILLVTPMDSAAVVVAVVRAPGAAPCPAEHPSVGAPLHPVTIVGGVRPSPGTYWFALVAAEGTVRVQDNVPSGDLDGDGVREYFRICTSMEGLHHTVWSGAALTGRRRWHAYVPLYYDVEPSCDERDYRDP